MVVGHELVSALDVRALFVRGSGDNRNDCDGNWSFYAASQRHMSNWLTDEEWSKVENQVPILCVDALPLRCRSSTQVGLILRDTPTQGRRWCFVGGRVRLDESVKGALGREWKSAFGVPISIATAISAPHLVEYQRTERNDGPFDTRKHAVSATFGVVINDTPNVTGGEALAFRWFDAESLTGTLMGFGQNAIVSELLRSPAFAAILREERV